MSATFDTVAGIISESCDIPQDKITPGSHMINDLGMDSLDFATLAFAIDEAFGVRLPFQEWSQQVDEGTISEVVFVLKTLCGEIDKLVAEKHT